MKINQLKNIIKKLFNNDKLFNSALFKSNEKCFQGDLYSSLVQTSNDFYLEYPHKNSPGSTTTHIDIASVSFNSNNCITDKINCITDKINLAIEIKHHCLNQNSLRLNSKTTENLIIKDIKSDIEKIQEIKCDGYVVYLLSYYFNVNQNCNFPMKETYLKNTKYDLNDVNTRLSNIKNTLNKQFNSQFSNVSINPRTISGVCNLGFEIFIIKV